MSLDNIGETPDRLKKLLEIKKHQSGGGGSGKTEDMPATHATRNSHLQLIYYPKTRSFSKSMPPEKAKDEVNNDNFKTPPEKPVLQTSKLKLASAQIEIEQTKFEGILQLSLVQQMTKD